MIFPSATPNPPPLEGVPVVLNGTRYILPPCSLATLKRHAVAIDKFSKMDAASAFGIEAVDTVVNVTTEALRRNYPDLTAEVVAEHIGLDTMMDFFRAAMDASGLLRQSLAAATSTGAAATGDQAAGEGGTLGESTGTGSSPTS